MIVEWDEAKNQRNLAKHNIGFELAQEVFPTPWLNLCWREW